MSEVTFLNQQEPIDEYGRALAAVGRSVLRALLDSLSVADLTDVNAEAGEVTMRQLAKVVRIDRDKGMQGDGFEWAVHEAIVGGEPRVTEPVAAALAKASPTFKSMSDPTSLLFGYERAKYLGFLEATVKAAGSEAVLLPDGQGHPFAFGPWVSVAAEGKSAEARLKDRIKSVWKTDIFLSDQEELRYAAATIKSNHTLLEAGPGLRIGIVPEATNLAPGTHRREGLWLAVLPDRDGFMALFHDGFQAVAEAMDTLGKMSRGKYYMKPSVSGQKMQAQLEKYPTAKVVDVVDALNEIAQQQLVGVSTKMVSVQAPDWLSLKEKAPKVIAPRPSFEPL
ncbi:hypothetical protein IFT77_11850 [Frigoribacterium sp. CFBP 13729]|uniref:hypothetical protein n=1 Tax=Frigoribacterium sp. CFBP 13729 TaxID=2775293 RepID=UPI00177CBD2C|nr:hypothetical protein [Frigoribacterium sp. CFBP 13729]MBD8611182.1 hypothetical protein [Frigoribacterium sp. CFBP 13729]